MDEMTARAVREAADQLEGDTELGEQLSPGTYLKRLGPLEVVLTVVTGPGPPLRLHYGGVDFDKAFPSG
jgi:hypothetical protein